LLAKPTNEVWDIDVARNLIVEGRFGGPSPQPNMFPAPWWFEAPLSVLVALAGFLIFRRVRSGVSAMRAPSPAGR